MCITCKRSVLTWKLVLTVWIRTLMLVLMCVSGYMFWRFGEPYILQIAVKNHTPSDFKGKKVNCAFLWTIGVPGNSNCTTCNGSDVILWICNRDIRFGSDFVFTSEYVIGTLELVPTVLCNQNMKVGSDCVNQNIDVSTEVLWFWCDFVWICNRNIKVGSEDNCNRNIKVGSDWITSNQNF